MSDSLLLAILASVTLVVVLLIFRARLTRFFVRFKHIDAELNAEPLGRGAASPTGVLVKGNKQTGIRNTIDVDIENAEVIGNTQRGDANAVRITDTHDPPSR